MRCPHCNAEIDPSITFCPECGKSVDPLIGQRFAEKYVLQKKIGEGGFGAVYAAEEKRFERQVAIKILHPRVLRDPSALARFRQEWIALSRLEHAAALRLFDVGQTDDGLVWMATELLSGRTLEEHLHEKQKLSLTEALHILKPIFEVLSEAHQKGIIHRDLKPANIFLLQNNQSKLLDFGVAKLAGGSLTMAGLTLGTPKYMAPEQWESSAQVTVAADIYSLGVILYRALSGRLPWREEATNPLSFYQEAPLDLQQAMPECSAALRDVVMKSLDRSPSARFSSVMDLFRALESTIVISKPAETLQLIKPTPSPRRNLWLAAPAVIVVAFLLRPSGSSEKTFSSDPGVAMVQRAELECERGEAQSCSLLATFYESGSHVPKDAARASSLRERACKLAPGLSCDNLAFMLLSSQPPNRARAKEILQFSCDAKHGSSCTNLAAQFYAAGAAEEDKGKFLHSLERGCEFGSAEACFSAANHFSSSIPSELKKAKEFFERSCQLGHSGACREATKIEE
jgi:serine/threonine protein kinase